MFCSLTTSKFFVQVTPGLHCPLLRARGGPAPASRPESIRPLLGSLPPIEAPAKPGLLAPSSPLHSRTQLPFLEASAESAQGYLGLSPSRGNGRGCRPSMILAHPVPACGFSAWGLPRPCRLPPGAAFGEATLSASGLGGGGTSSAYCCDFTTLPGSPAARISLPLFPPSPDPQLPVGSSLSWVKGMKKGSQVLGEKHRRTHQLCPAPSRCLAFPSKACLLSMTGLLPDH